MTASGDVADYTASVQAAIIANFASAARVPQSRVSLRVSAASVRLEITIESASKAAADTAQNSLAPALADASTAADLMPAGFTVESTPTIAVVAAPEPGTRLSPPPPSPLAASSGSLGGLLGGVFGGAAILLGLVYLHWRRSPRRAKTVATDLFAPPRVSQTAGASEAAGTSEVAWNEFLTSHRDPEQRDSQQEHAAISAAQRQARSPGQPVPRPSALAQSLLQVNEAARQLAAQEREDGPDGGGGPDGPDGPGGPDGPDGLGGPDGPDGLGGPERPREVTISHSEFAVASTEDVHPEVPGGDVAIVTCTCAGTGTGTGTGAGLLAPQRAPQAAGTSEVEPPAAQQPALSVLPQPFQSEVPAAAPTTAGEASAQAVAPKVAQPDPSGGSTPQSTNRPLVEFLTSYRTPEQRDSPREHAAISAAQRQARSPGQPVPRPSALAQSLLQVNEAARQRAAQEREDGPGRPGGALEAFEA